MVSKVETKSARSVDEETFRNYDDSEMAKLYYMDKVKTKLQ